MTQSKVDYSIMEYCISDQKGSALDLVTLLNKQRDNPENCDLDLKVGNDKVATHKCVMTAKSPYFQTMLTSDFLEGRLAQESHSGSMTIDMSHTVTDFSSLNEIINFIYTGHMVISQHSVEEILAISSLLLIKDIQEFCSQHLLMNLTLSNCLETLALANLYELTNMRNVAQRLVNDRFHDVVINGDEILNVPAEFLSKLLKDDTVRHCSTFQLISLVLRWVNEKKDERLSKLEELVGAFEWKSLDELEYSELKKDGSTFSTIEHLVKKAKDKVVTASDSVHTHKCMVALTGSTQRMADQVANTEEVTLFDLSTKKWLEKTIVIDKKEALGHPDRLGTYERRSTLMGMIDHRFIFCSRFSSTATSATSLDTGVSYRFAELPDSDNVREVFIHNQALYCFVVVTAENKKTTRNASTRKSKGSGKGRAKKCVKCGDYHDYDQPGYSGRPSKSNSDTKQKTVQLMRYVEKKKEWKVCYESPLPNNVTSISISHASGEKPSDLYLLVSTKNRTKKRGLHILKFNTESDKIIETIVNIKGGPKAKTDQVLKDFMVQLMYDHSKLSLSYSYPNITVAARDQNYCVVYNTAAKTWNRKTNLRFCKHKIQNEFEYLKLDYLQSSSAHVFTPNDEYRVTLKTAACNCFGIFCFNTQECQIFPSPPPSKKSLTIHDYSILDVPTDLLSTFKEIEMDQSVIESQPFSSMEFRESQYASRKFQHYPLGTKDRAAALAAIENSPKRTRSYYDSDEEYQSYSPPPRYGGIGGLFPWLLFNDDDNSDEDEENSDDMEYF
ncbi:unnamed protein product [Owenia fusiformis]|uniref:BTB domain-containing protein n=1 Tax=Owenia fusiformis TaxID=6347 RepID=A0A8S4NLB4_OWEFU|nr:unnamed protein product [Owenia fusiformis]